MKSDQIDVVGSKIGTYKKVRLVHKAKGSVLEFRSETDELTSQNIKVIGGGEYNSNNRSGQLNKVMSEKTLATKLEEIVRRVRLRSTASKLINSTRSRMLKSMKPIQYSFINDFAQDFSDLKSRNKRIDLNPKLSSNQYLGIFTGFFSVLRRIIRVIPIINPNSNMKLFWEILISIQLLYSFFVFTVMVSFGVSEEEISFSFIIDAFIIGTLFDILCACNTGFYKRGILCSNRSSILRKYYYEQMKIDLISLLSIFIFRGIRLVNETDFNKFSFLTLFALFKWNGVVRMTKNTSQRYMLRPNLRNALSLLGLTFKILMIAHACSCVWLFISRISEDMYGSSWIRIKNLTNETWKVKYLSAFYFSTVTMATVGYGDIVPTTPLETIICMVMVLFACGVFGFSVNTIQIILADFSKNENAIQENMLVIQKFLHERNINPVIGKDVTEYLEYFWRACSDRNQEAEKQILSQLSENLRIELLIDSYKIVLRDCAIFQNNFSQDIIKQVIPIIKEQQYTPNEVIYSCNNLNDSKDKSIYFIQEGLVEIFIEQTIVKQNEQTSRSQKSVLRFQKGEFFGHIEFFTDQCRTHSVRSLNFSKIIQINRSEFLQILQKSPQDYEQFCYIRDRLIFQKDSTDVNQKCPSCFKNSHSLDDCPYIHFIPNIPKTIAIYNRSLKQPRNSAPPERRNFQKERMALGDLLELTAEFTQYNEDLIDDYIQNHLSYQISKCDVCSSFSAPNQSINSIINKNSDYVDKSTNSPKCFLEQKILDKIRNYSARRFTKQLSNSEYDRGISMKLKQYQNQKSNLKKQITKYEKDFEKQISFIQTYEPYQQSKNVNFIHQIDNNLENDIPLISFRRKLTPNSSLKLHQTINESIKTEAEKIDHFEVKSIISTQKSVLNSLQYPQQTFNKISNLNEQKGEIHVKMLLFDTFCGYFECMRQYESYYPLNNYQNIIKQLYMDEGQRRRMKRKLEEQHRQYHLNVVLKKKKNIPRNSLQTYGIDVGVIRKLIDREEKDFGTPISNAKINKMSSFQLNGDQQQKQSLQFNQIQGEVKIERTNSRILNQNDQSVVLDSISQINFGDIQLPTKKRIENQNNLEGKHSFGSSAIESQSSSEFNIFHPQYSEVISPRKNQPQISMMVEDSPIFSSNNQPEPKKEGRPKDRSLSPPRNEIHVLNTEHPEKPNIKVSFYNSKFDEYVEDMRIDSNPDL